MGIHREIDQVPPAFEAAIAQLEAVDLRPEIVVSTIPAPQRIAPYTHAISGDVVAHHEEIASGRFILLHDPAGNDAWGATFRCVTYARAEVEPEMAADPALPTVGWSWLGDALDNHEASHLAASGSVTVVSTEAFGEMADEDARAQIEVRASWTPTSALTVHVEAWSDLLCAIAGLPPLTAGVVPLQSRRGSR